MDLALYFGCSTGGTPDSFRSERNGKSNRLERLDLISTGATIVGILPPARTAGVDEVDEDVAALASEVIDRLLTRKAEWIGRERRAPADIGYVDAHAASNAAVERSLRRRRISTEVLATTPEIWQGLERPVMVMKHPLSGTGRLDRFSLEPGAAMRDDVKTSDRLRDRRSRRR